MVPMHEENMAILKSLVSVAWADGDFADREKEMLDALLEAFEATDEEAEALKEYAREPKTVDDIPITELSYDDRRIFLQHAVFLSHVDGSFSAEERSFIDKVTEKLRIPDDEAQELIELAEARAKRYFAAAE